jgi:outer membrane protein OmpA-like peptidoglycan-associated protein
LLLLTLACATPEPQELIQVQDRFRTVEANPEVQQNASVELYEAKQALQRAESEWNRNENSEETRHLAYLASRRLEVAELWAAGRKAYKEGQQLQQQSTQEASAMVAAAKAANERERKLREELADLQARETARGLELTLGDILFDVDQASLKPGAAQNLHRLVAFLKEYPDRAVLVEGHTDNTGTDAYNLSLSERRAESVRTFLIESGIAASRVLARGYGKAYPITGNDTAAGRQRNRRVEIVILHSGESPEGRLRPAAP